jgi:hypothetical protein
MCWNPVVLPFPLHCVQGHELFRSLEAYRHSCPLIYDKRLFVFPFCVFYQSFFVSSLSCFSCPVQCALILSSRALQCYGLLGNLHRVCMSIQMQQTCMLVCAHICMYTSQRVHMNSALILTPLVLLQRALKWFQEVVMHSGGIMHGETRPLQRYFGEVGRFQICPSVCMHACIFWISFIRSSLSLPCRRIICKPRISSWASCSRSNWEGTLRRSTTIRVLFFFLFCFVLFCFLECCVAEFCPY